MARGDILNARLLGRIAESGLVLTVHYPLVRPAATGSSPTAAPVSPLTGPPPATVVYPVAGTPIRAPVDIACLWYDATAFVPHRLRMIQPQGPGLATAAEAWAQVPVAAHPELGLSQGAALDEDDYLGDTIFTGALEVEFQGHKYRVLSVQPVGPGHRQAVTYYVWLAGAAKQ